MDRPPPPLPSRSPLTLFISEFATLGPGVTQLVYVYVDDVDKHFAAAKPAGAGILNEPADQFYGDRTYGAEDPEGHQWSVGQHVCDVAPEDMHP